jgi:hypothetical protein
MHLLCTTRWISDVIRSLRKCAPERLHKRKNQLDSFNDRGVYQFDDPVSGTLSRLQV